MRPQVYLLLGLLTLLQVFRRVRLPLQKVYRAAQQRLEGNNLRGHKVVPALKIQLFLLVLVVPPLARILLLLAVLAQLVVPHRARQKLLKVLTRGEVLRRVLPVQKVQETEVPQALQGQGHALQAPQKILASRQVLLPMWGTGYKMPPARQQKILKVPLIQKELNNDTNITGQQTTLWQHHCT